MGAYIAVFSLLQDLEQLLNLYDLLEFSMPVCPPLTKKEIELLYQCISSAVSLLRDSSGLGGSYNGEIVNQIVERVGKYVDFWAASYRPKHEFLFGRAAEGMLDLGVPDFSGILQEIEFSRAIFLRESKNDPSSPLHDERKVILNELAQDIDFFNRELKKIFREREVEHFEAVSSEGRSFTPSNPLRRTLTAEGKLVGLEKDFETMLHSLTGEPPQLKVFAIIGMAGIGKTTFSRKLYHAPLVMYTFHVRVWITVSQQYQVTELLLGILRCTTNFAHEIHGKTNGELKELVYKSLKGRRYLIVLDDMWDTNAWHDLRLIFPNDKNGSRILLTSRLRDVAVSASQDTPPHCLRRLSVDESWELLSSKIFGDESCPMEFMEIGKHIASRCQGLPLTIVVVGGLLSKMKKRVIIWEEVAQRVGSLVMEEAEHCQNILALSYNHLPNYLKPCFLNLFGSFPRRL